MASPVNDKWKREEEDAIRKTIAQAREAQLKKSLGASPSPAASSTPGPTPKRVAPSPNPSSELAKTQSLSSKSGLSEELQTEMKKLREEMQSEVRAQMDSYRAEQETLVADGIKRRRDLQEKKLAEEMRTMREAMLAAVEQERLALVEDNKIHVRKDNQAKQANAHADRAKRSAGTPQASPSPAVKLDGSSAIKGASVAPSLALPSAAIAQPGQPRDMAGMLEALNQDQDGDGVLDGDLDGDGRVSVHEQNVAIQRELAREKAVRLEGVSKRRVEDDLNLEVAQELTALRAQVREAEEKEDEMHNLRRLYKSHYRSRYAYMKPHNPSSVLGDHWDLEPGIYTDLAGPERVQGVEEEGEGAQDAEDSAPSPPKEIPGGSWSRSKKEPIPPNPVAIEELTHDTLKDHSVIMESRVRWLNHLSNMLPLKIENRGARKELTAERMETEEVVAAYTQIIACVEAEGEEAVIQRVSADAEFIGPGNVISLAEFCTLPPGTPSSTNKDQQLQQEWERVLQQRPDWNTHLNGGSLRFWKGVPKDRTYHASTTPMRETQLIG